MNIFLKELLKNATMYCILRNRKTQKIHKMLRNQSRGCEGIQKLNRILIIADDLTGANDTGVQFAKQGFHTLSILSLKEKNYKQKADVLVFNAETRSMAPKEAYQKMKAVAKSLAISDFPFIYKKIDSTMRGNIGSEIDALLDTGIFDIAIVLPAYPKNGRVTIGGYHIVNQCLLEDSEISRDPKCPVNESHLPTLLEGQSSRGIAHVDLGKIRKKQVPEEIRECIDRNEEIVVFDSFLQNDLKSVTNAVLESGLKALWVGSAGLAETLSEALEPPAVLKEKVTIKPGLKGNLPVFTIAGSVSAVTNKQIKALTDQRDCRQILANPYSLLNEDTQDQEIERLATAILEVIDEGCSPVLTTDASGQMMEDLHSLRKKTGKSSVEMGNKIAESLGKVGASVISRHDIAGLILTGGDIANSTCEQLGIEALRIDDEVEEGIPLCEILGSKVDGLPLVTKAGAFGHADSLVNAMNKICKINSLIRG